MLALCAHLLSTHVTQTEVLTFIKRHQYSAPPAVPLISFAQLDRVWGRGDGAMLKPKFTGIAVFVAEVTAPYTRLLGVYKHSFGASEGSKGGKCGLR